MKEESWLIPSYMFALVSLRKNQCDNFAFCNMRVEKAKCTEKENVLKNESYGFMEWFRVGGTLRPILFHPDTFHCPRVL